MMKESKKGFPNPEWLRRMADAEDRCASVAAGGLVQHLGMLPGTTVEPLRVFGRFLEFARRAKGMTVEELATAADVDLAEIVAIESDGDTVPAPRTVYQLAAVLRLPPARLMELAGLAAPRQALSQAAVRFAARSESTAKLSAGEREAFEEFVKVLVEASDGA